MEDFLITYGYLALVLGVLLEGEAALIAASLAAHQGYLVISAVIGTAFVVTLTLDWSYFFLGRYQGRNFLIRRPHLLEKTKRIHQWIERYPKSLMLCFRFIYGFRILIPLLIGTTQVKVRQFLLFSAISTLLWSIAFGLAGYFMGAFLQTQLERLKQYQTIIIGGLVAIGLLFLLFRYLRKKRAQSC
ncbi:MAG: DedA family protein [Bacteroidota bacterium]